MIDVPITNTAYSFRDYVTFGNGVVSSNITVTIDNAHFIFQLNNGSIIPRRQSAIGAQFSLMGTFRPTVNDTYSIQIGNYQIIYGHF